MEGEKSKGVDNSDVGFIANMLNKTTLELESNSIQRRDYQSLLTGITFTYI